MSREVSPLNHCGLDTQGIQNWDPPPPWEELFIPGKGDSIFIKPFLLKTELSSKIVSNLECNNRI